MGRERSGWCPGNGRRIRRTGLGGRRTWRRRVRMTVINQHPPFRLGDVGFDSATLDPARRRRPSAWRASVRTSSGALKKAGETPGNLRPRLVRRLERSHYGQLEKMSDLVAVWEVALSDGVHKIEFEHGTTSGKRVVYVDGKEGLRHSFAPYPHWEASRRWSGHLHGQEEIRKEWMFKLVGKETFTVGAAKAKATINIDAVSGFAYEYTLEIDGKSLKKYMESRSKTTNTWVLSLDGMDCRVVLEKDTMDVWCNGKKMETVGEFVEDGTETHFSVGNHDCCIKAVSSGKRREGIIHTLIVDDREIPEAVE
ncbi:fas apoptotic inhibitory molecule 1 isoform X1 [Alligator mississippiensis]|uniref:fas apoptotic inhibitory molecule 1 isoform X1 n=1 Tax=Alligator mississippiensis TaxID=8496 RepID=UPI0028777375|nr:fas apoptotic inhibitory molecule 1 isoform X1 [Alligator mississippiensis]